MCCSGEFYLGFPRAELQGVSWYRLLHWESTREAQTKHRLSTSLTLNELPLFNEPFLSSYPVGAGALLHPAGSDPKEVRRLDLDALRATGQRDVGEQPAAGDRLHEPGFTTLTVCFADT